MSDEQTKWLDAPTGDMPHWVATLHYGSWRKAIAVDPKKYRLPGYTQRWLPINVPRDPPPEPLPRSKQVTLTARRLECSCGGKVEIYVDGILTKQFHDSYYRHLPGKATEMVIATYGIEPEIVEAP